MPVNVFLPFFLTINANLSQYLNLDTAYAYNVSKVIIKYGEPFELTQLTSTITCQPIFLDRLSCFMHDITSETTVKYSWQGIGKVTTYILKVNKWFKMWFNKRGLLKIQIPSVDVEIKHFIKHISQQFSLGINIADYKRKLQMGVLLKFIADEKTSIGNCKTEYNIDVANVKNASKETNSTFQIRPLYISTYYPNQEDFVRVHIMKYRTKCDYSTMSDNDNLNETLTVANYGHEIKADVNKFKILTTMDVYLSKTDPKTYSDPWTPVAFSETTEIKLINVFTLLNGETYEFLE